jgi:branched-chain amino acid transport system ATP-binding protein
VTIVLVEQNARAALGCGRPRLCAGDGRIALEGPANELANDPRVIDTYLGAAKKAA